MDVKTYLITYSTLLDATRRPYSTSFFRFGLGRKGLLDVLLDILLDVLLDAPLLDVLLDATRRLLDGYSTVTRQSSFHLGVLHFCFKTYLSVPAISPRGHIPKCGAASGLPCRRGGWAADGDGGMGWVGMHGPGPLWGMWVDR